MRTSHGRADGRPRRHRAGVLGFVVGAALVVPGVFLALLVPVAERVWPVLTPGVALLRPLSAVMASWPGGLNLLVAAVVNGLVVGALAALVAVLIDRRR